MPELITFKMEKEFLKEVDSAAKESHFHSRTEFIREALREKMDKIALEKAMKEISKLKGSSKKKTTEKEYEEAREKAFEAIAKQFR